MLVRGAGTRTIRFDFEHVGEGIGRDVNATLSADRRAASGWETEEGTLKVPSSGPQSGFDYQAYLTPICAPMLLKP